MIPLRVTCQLVRGIILSRPIHLDGLLGAAVALRDQLPPPLDASSIVPIELPLARERGVWLASASEHVVEARELRYINRRFPLNIAQMMGAKSIKTIDIKAGPSASERTPVDVQHLESDLLTWWCVGDATEIRALLTLVHHVGRKRGVGFGEVAPGGWAVDACEPWGDGFPAMRDGMPTRNLPTDWPGLSPDAIIEYAPPSPPYWERTRDTLCAVPL